eukprot:2121532-Pleurochrysis_carterae.AAC.3
MRREFVEKREFVRRRDSVKRRTGQAAEGASTEIERAPKLGELKGRTEAGHERNGESNKSTKGRVEKEEKRFYGGEKNRGVRWRQRDDWLRRQRDDWLRPVVADVPGSGWRCPSLHLQASRGAARLTQSRGSQKSAQTSARPFSQSRRYFGTLATCPVQAHYPGRNECRARKLA